MKRLSALSMLLAMILSPKAYSLSSFAQAHLRAGMVAGSFTGVADGSFAVPTSVEGEAEYMYSSKISLLARSTISLEASTGQFKYISMGIGQRFYLYSRSGTGQSADEGIDIEISPRMSYYVDWLLSISQIQVKKVTSTLIVQSTLLEYGVAAGIIYPIGRKVGIEGSLGVSKGVAMSSVSIDSLIVRGLVGAVLTF